MGTITALSSQAWIDRHPLKLERYLRRNHKREDIPIVLELLYDKFPDEGKKLVKNFDLLDVQKKILLIEWIYFQPQITCGIFADQRMGKDALICEIFTEVINYCKARNLKRPRFVTLGNIRKPPFVDEEDMYFSFKNIPSKSKDGRQVWIYCSEMETVLPAREGMAPENKLFAQLEGTLAQNGQKLFGCCKLASKVDLNFIRGMNCKLFKYISPEKLNVEGVERVNILSNLGNWLLPANVHDKPKTLMAFDNQLLTVNYGLPLWWSEEYSEQFRDVPLDKVKDYVEVMHSNGMNPTSIQTAIAQKFRRILTKEQVYEFMGFVDDN